MDANADLFVRAIAFLFGLWNAGHYFAGAVALNKAPHWVKSILFPSLVAGNVGLCLAAVLYGSGMVAVVAMPLYALVSIKDFVIWRAGAYMSEVLDRHQRIKELDRQAFNRYRSDLTTPWESVADLVTPSGFEEMADSDKRAKERHEL